MQTKETDTQKVLKMVKNVAPKHCDICGHKYEDSDFHLVKNQGNQTVIHLRCDSCGNTYMLNVFNPAQGLLGSTRAQLNLDLAEANEVMNFAGNKPLTTNEALDAYNLLTKSSALHSLFKATSRSKKTVKFDLEEDFTI